MTGSAPLLLVLDLLGTLAVARNGALTALEVVRLDIVGPITLGHDHRTQGRDRAGRAHRCDPPATFARLALQRADRRRILIPRRQLEALLEGTPRQRA